VEMRELLRSLKGEHTILLSSHILSEISETCDRILVIRDGQIAASGTEAELSAKLVKNQRFDVTVRGDEDQAREAARAVPGVVSVEAVDPTEAGDNVCTLRIESESDVREAVCRALVAGDLGLLEVRRGERELESVFLELAGPAGDGAKEPLAKKKTGKKGAKKARPAAEDGSGT
jgi:ABC-2 type transport system ATP-binding protein